MDAVAGLLDGPRARGAFVLRSVLEAPWAMRIADSAPLCLMALVRGSAWVCMDDAEPLEVTAGDVWVVRGPAHYTLCSAPGAPLSAVVLPGDECVGPDGRPVASMRRLGVRTWGNAADASSAPTVLLNGTYHLEGEVSGRLLRALPPLLVLRREEWDAPFAGLLAAEIVRDDPGQEAVLDRLLDLMLIAFLRTWFARPEAGAPGWYRAHADPVVGPALRLIHHEPARQWTVATMAREVGVSRATLARRFAELVGEPPMAFLTGWRIALAADLLKEPGATIGSVAPRVGYGSPFALSAAFKRVRGISPAAHRAA